MTGLEQAFFDRPVLEVAPDLLGCLLAGPDVTVRITEVEAYDGAGDPASHAFRGRTPRNAVMFGPPGHLYVYFTYGMHFCANVVCGPEGVPSAVLLRAGEVVDGLAVARARRPAARRDRNLADGPAKLLQVLGMDGTANGTPLLDGTGPLALRAPVDAVPPAAVEAGPRVGVSSAHDVPWRFWIAGDPTVSAYRRHAAQTRHRPTPSRPGG